MNDFFKTLANNNSRNFKIEFLTMHKDNELFKEVIRLALDPFTQFYIRKIPDYVTSGYNRPMGESLEMLMQLSNRVYTGNAAIDFLRDILSNSNDPLTIERIIQKDLKCGVSIATANAVWPNLIHEYPCMLCSAYDQKLVDKIQYPAIVQQKEDGMRFNAIVRNGAVEFRSRNGKEVQLLGNLEPEFLELANGVELVFDGELLVQDNGTILDRQTGNGILNKANKGTITNDQASKVVAIVWDVIPYQNFLSGIDITPYEKRYNHLHSLLSKTNQTKISLVPSWAVNSYEEAQVIFRKLLNEGKEGIILKDCTAIWEDKRSKQQIKFKAVLDADLKCVGIEEGTGKYEGMIGSLICETSDGIVKVSVGSGLTDDDRKKPAEYYIDKVIAVTYNGKITNKQGEQSLFLPIYLETRFDKDIANSSKELK